MDTPAEQASADAVHKTKNAQQAVEVARQLQLDSVVEETARKTKEALLEGLKEVFGDSDSEAPGHMKVLVRRIPILCTNVEKMHGDIQDIKNDFRWMKWIGSGFVAAAGMLAMKALGI